MFTDKLKQRKKIYSGGFVFVEFAIALPLLILIIYGLGLVSIKFFFLARGQLADYVLESEAQYVMERITQDVRTAKEIKAQTNKKITITYHAIDENSVNSVQYVDDVSETQIFLIQKKNDDYVLYAQRTNGYANSPLTGDNYFGNTTISSLEFSELNKNVLHIELVMKSSITGHEIKIATAVFIPGLDEPMEIN